LVIDFVPKNNQRLFVTPGILLFLGTVIGSNVWASLRE